MLDASASRTSSTDLDPSLVAKSYVSAWLSSKSARARYADGTEERGAELFAPRE